MIQIAALYRQSGSDRLEKQPTDLRRSPRDLGDGALALQRLRQNGEYWRFYWRNTRAGYFEVSRSEAAYASVRID